MTRYAPRLVQVTEVLSLWKVWDTQIDTPVWGFCTAHEDAAVSFAGLLNKIYAGVTTAIRQKEGATCH